MKKKIAMILSGLLLVSALCTFGGSTTVAAEEADDYDWPEMRLSYAGQAPEDTFNGYHAKVFMDEIERRTGGKITFDRYFNGTLYSGAELYSALVDGSVDMVTNYWLYVPAQTPLYQMVLSVPFTTTDNRLATEIAREFAEQEPAFEDQAEKEGYHVLANFAVTEYQIFSKGAIKSWKDMNGRKLNFGGVYYAPMFETAGVAQVAGGIADFYQSVKTGVASGMFIDTADAAMYKYYEITDSVYDCEMGSRATFALSINKDVYDAMDPKVQELFDEVGLYAEQEHLRWYEEEQKPKDDEALSVLEYTKITPEDKAEWAEAIQNSGNDPIDMWIAQADEAGYNGREIINKYLAFIESKGHEFPFDTSKYAE